VNVRWQTVQPFFADLGSSRDVERIQKLEGRYAAPIFWSDARPSSVLFPGCHLLQLPERDADLTDHVGALALELGVAARLHAFSCSLNGLFCFWFDCCFPSSAV
jgi:hypothetical protein